MHPVEALGEGLSGPCRPDQRCVKWLPASYNREILLMICQVLHSLEVNNAAEHEISITTVYPTKYAHGFCFAVLCCGYTLTDFPISIRLTSLALWQSNDCPSASKTTLMNMDKYLMWIHYKRLHNHNKAKHNKTVCIFLGIYCTAHDISKSDENAMTSKRLRVTPNFPKIMKIQYIPRNMHTVLLCFALLWLCNRS